MVRLERVSRASFFEGWTRGFIFGLVVFVATVASAYFIGTRTELDMTLCLLRRFGGIPCPLCGGTTASFALASGRPSDAFTANPMVTLVLPLVALWILAWIGFGHRVKLTLPKALLVSAGLLLVAVNWAYVISVRS